MASTQAHKGWSFQEETITIHLDFIVFILIVVLTTLRLGKNDLGMVKFDVTLSYTGTFGKSAAEDSTDTKFQWQEDISPQTYIQPQTESAVTENRLLPSWFICVLVKPHF